MFPAMLDITIFAIQKNREKSVRYSILLSFFVIEYPADLILFLFRSFIESNDVMNDKNEEPRRSYVSKSFTASKKNMVDISMFSF